MVAVLTYRLGLWGKHRTSTDEYRTVAKQAQVCATGMEDVGLPVTARALECGRESGAELRAAVKRLPAGRLQKAFEVLEERFSLLVRLSTPGAHESDEEARKREREWERLQPRLDAAFKEVFRLMDHGRGI
ncbi:hypothetical protein ACWCYY_33400 [Kitasatospora sp. NPDC001664]